MQKIDSKEGKVMANFRLDYSNSGDGKVGFFKLVLTKKDKCN